MGLVVSHCCQLRCVTRAKPTEVPDSEIKLEVSGGVQVVNATASQPENSGFKSLVSAVNFNTWQTSADRDSFPESDTTCHFIRKAKKGRKKISFYGLLLQLGLPWTKTWNSMRCYWYIGDVLGMPTHRPRNWTLTATELQYWKRNGCQIMTYRTDVRNSTEVNV